jgi:geranyl-CoA carboxylase beta subunit
MGSCTAGGAYVPAMSDETVIVKEQGTIFIGGPPLVKAATGVDVTPEELGGADVHCRISGVSDHYALNDRHALEITRNIMQNLPRAGKYPLEVTEPEEPRYDPQELYGVIPKDLRKPFDMREVIARVVDDSDFLEFKPLYGAATVVGHAAIQGRKVGIVTNNGPLDPAGASKATHFIQACCQSGHALVYLQNTTGYIVGKEPEQSGMIKHGAKMIQAVSNANVPQVTLMCGASFGAGNYGMCGFGYRPRFLFSWPNAQIAVMGGEQAATTMAIVTEASLRRKGVAPDPAMIEGLKQRIVATFESQQSAFAVSALMLDDGVIDPRDTRNVLGFALSVCDEADARMTRPVQFGVARP